jgi:methylmalonyl-CoA epimerase
MKIIGIEHIGIASDDLSKANKFWSLVLGIKNTCTEDIDNQGVITDIYDTGNGKIELLLAKYPDSAIAKFIRKRGCGIHHICLNVECIDDAINELKEKNIETIGNGYNYGAEGYKVIFIHPRSTGGVLLELAERI